MFDAVRTRRCRTSKGRTEGSSEGRRFLEDHSKAAVRSSIHSRVREPSGGQEMGILGDELTESAAGGGFSGDMEEAEKRGFRRDGRAG